MSIELLVFNNSHDWREGCVTTEWQPIFERTGIPPERVVIRDSSGAQLAAQVDMADPSRAVLAFSLNEKVRPRPDDYWSHSTHVTVDSGTPTPRDHASPDLIVEGPAGRERGVVLKNSRLEVKISLVPTLTGGGGNWYGGAAHSVQLDGKEILDAFRAEIDWIDHDVEKRCMQVDRLELFHAAWESTATQSEYLINQPYKLISKSVGPLRATVTIASQAFDYVYWDPYNPERRVLRTRLYRVITLTKDADYVCEELYVRGTPDENLSNLKPVDLYFTARYFTYMKFGRDVDMTRFARIADWFVLGCFWHTKQGYGFTTDVHIGPVLNPHPEYPKQGKEENSFSWELPRNQRARCLHLFKRCDPQELANQVGVAWYHHIYKPLTARIK